jgi:hypothetical protein
MNIEYVAKFSIGFVGGGVAACAGALLSVNPVTLKVMDFAKKMSFKGLERQAEDFALKVSSVVHIGCLVALLRRSISSCASLGFMTGAVFFTAVDFLAYSYIVCVEASRK